MIVTEEEAKTKRCQESFAVCREVSDQGHVFAMMHTGGAMPAYTAPAMCIGSACMAWRWQRTEDGLPATDEFLGYCGKAGLP